MAGWLRRFALSVSAFLGAGLLTALAARAPEAGSLLVLPFSNPSANRHLDWIGDSVSEILIENLAAEGIDVVAPELRDQTMDETSLRRYAVITRASAIEAAVQANASLVLYGTFEIRAAAGRQEAGGMVRLSAHLLDARRLRRLGSFLVEKPLSELSAAQTALAWQVLHTLRPDFLVTEEEFGRNHPAVRLDALENYARGLRASNPEQKHKLLATAVRLAPDFSPALYQLGRLNLLAFKNYTSAASWFEKVGALRHPLPGVAVPARLLPLPDRRVCRRRGRLPQACGNGSAAGGAEQPRRSPCPPQRSRGGGDAAGRCRGQSGGPGRRFQPGVRPVEGREVR